MMFRRFPRFIVVSLLMVLARVALADPDTQAVVHGAQDTAAGDARSPAAAFGRPAKR